MLAGELTEFFASVREFESACCENVNMSDILNQAFYISLSRKAL